MLLYTHYTPLICCFPLSSPYFLFALQLILHTPLISSYFITAQTAFHHCTFSFTTAHFVHHCTLKQALPQTNPIVVSTPTLSSLHCQWEDATSKERTGHCGHLNACDKAKKVHIWFI